jgi:ubiquinol-cytochrome c reductase cytochrome c1 subunit
VKNKAKTIYSIVGPRPNLRLSLAIMVSLLLLLHFKTIHGMDKSALQRGATFFITYCSGCHSLKYTSYQRIADDLSLPQAGSDNLLEVSLPESDAKHWFGQMPPDLSLTARVRGKIWIKKYLTGFYPDKTRPFGVNNRLLPDSSMPNVLAPLKQHLFQKNSSQQLFDTTLEDAISFLAYIAEPASLIRYQTGFFALSILFVLGILFMVLKRIS